MSSGIANKIRKIEDALKNCKIGHPLVFIEKIDSTNDELKKLAHLGATEGTVIWAEEQTSGRGRAGKEWLSKKGMGLYVSILLKPGWAFDEASFIPLLAAASVAKTLEGLKMKKIAIKWPNDIEIDGKKIAGVLAENCYASNKLVFSVVGVGINVSHKSEDFSGMEFNKPPTSLLMERVKISIDALLIQFLQNFESWYLKALHNGIWHIIEESNHYRKEE